MLAERIDEMKDSAFADAKTIEHLKSNRSDMQDCIKLRENQIAELESKMQGQYDDIVMLEREVEVYTKKYNELVKQKEHQADHADAKRTATSKRHVAVQRVRLNCFKAPSTPSNNQRNLPCQSSPRR